MPIIIMTGTPSSGKTTRANELCKILHSYNVTVHLVSDNLLFKSQGLDPNKLYVDSNKEKEVRGVLKSQAVRNLSDGQVVILDSGNYIKGYRYEIYCEAKNTGHTQLLVECVVPKSLSWAWNTSRPDGLRYNQEVFDFLCMRYEAPDSRNRWDSPLITLSPEQEIVGQAVFDSLFKSKPPPPNESVASVPLSKPSHLYELDKWTQEAVTNILNGHKQGIPAEKICVGCDSRLERLPSSLNPAMMARYRRQFLNLNKLHPVPVNKERSELVSLFVQYLNSSWKELA